ncbi:MAG: futalosine hydrolase [Deltaproteobacteria bacterium]|jgi:futalosine hydrolase|nr:futalosine hydrolase [Deltaproteobacteria bacterium]
MLLCATATRQEFLAVFPGWNGAPAEHRILPIRRGSAACITGVGPINAGIAIGRILALHGEISGVLNLGLAGGFDLARAPLGSCTLVTEEIWPEYGLLGDNGIDAQGLGFAQWENDGRPVFDRLPLLTDMTVLGLPQPVDAIPGISLTVAGVSASAKRAAMLAQRHHPLSENMEGFAVALACARQAVPCAELRVISNKVGSRAPQDRAFPLALAQLGALGQYLFDQKNYEHSVTNPSRR